MEAKFLVISGDKRISNFMSACDVFEKGKVIGNIEYMNITFNDDVKLTLKKASVHKYIILESLEKCDRIVSLIHLLQIKNKNKIIVNNSIEPYVNKDVRCVSNGDKWFMLDDYLKYLNISVETDQFRFITNVGKTKKIK